jgi:hypothetical protein
MVVPSTSKVLPLQNQRTDLVRLVIYVRSLADYKTGPYSVVVYRKSSIILPNTPLINSLGADHLPRDAIESHNTDVVQSTYGKGIVDEAMQWNRDRDTSSVDSSSDSGAVSSADTSSKSSRGLDPTTLYFKKQDVIMLVDGTFTLCIARLMRQTRMTRDDI